MWKQMKDSEKLLLKVLFIFMVIQPFLDIKYLLTDPSWQFLGFTIPTIVRCVGIFTMAILSLRYIKVDKEHIIYAVYFIALGLYFIGHHIFASMQLNIPDSYTYSLFSEAFYFLRMMFPFFMVYVVRHATISYRFFSNTILVSSLIIGCVIVISNLFHISLTTYANGGDHNLLNFIEWFTKDVSQYSFETLTSKGWFFMGNQISGLIMLLLPINIYEVITKPRTLSFFSTLFLMISMILLGTRITTYGSILASICMILAYLYFKWIKKDTTLKWKNLGVFSIIFICILVLFVNSPIQNRVYSYGEVESVEVPDDESFLTGENTPTVEEFILSAYKSYKIQDAYIFEIYPYKDDPQFWVNFFKTNTKYVLNNRDMQKLISNHIVALNDSIPYKFFGYSYSRFTNGNLYLEHDFIVHYYTVGILGILLLLFPWIYWICKGGICMLMHYKSRFHYLNIALLMGITACVGSSLFSGHIVDELIVTLYLGFVCGYFIKTAMLEQKDEVL